MPDGSSPAPFFWSDLPKAQAVFCRRRHQPRRPPLARIRPGRPAPTMGPGARERTGAMIVFTHGFAELNQQRIIELAARERLPTMYGWREFVIDGGLMSYGPNIPVIIRRAASYVDRILKGEKPGDLPIEQPTRLELIVNLKTARALGLNLPPTLLARADEVIE